MARGTRLSARDWELAALDAIGEGGIAAVAVEPLARRLGVTKGSFYWHFPDVRTLLDAALRRWEAATHQILEVLSGLGDPRDRLRPVFLAVAIDTRAQSLFLAIAAAADHPSVRPVLQRVTDAWAEFLTDACRDLGLPKKEARHRALLIHSAFVGFLHLLRESPGVFSSQRARREFLEHSFDWLVPRQPGASRPDSASGAGRERRR